MTPDPTLQLITQYGIFAGLFFWILRYVLKENAKRNDKSDLREEWLQNHLTESQQINKETVGTLQLMKVEIKNELSDMKDGLVELKQILWKE